MVISVDVKHIFKYPLDVVAKVHFEKYTGKKDRFVERVDTVEQKTDLVEGVDYRKRIAICTNVVPKILRKINVLNEQNFILEEEAWLNWRKPEFRLHSCNITWSKYADIWEKSVFFPCPENPKWTVLEQHGEIDVKTLGPFGRVLELFAQGFLQRGARKGLKIMEDLLQERADEFMR